MTGRAGAIPCFFTNGKAGSTPADGTELLGLIAFLVDNKDLVEYFQRLP